MPCSEDMTPSGGCCSRVIERIDRCAPCAIAVLAVGPPSSRGATRLTEGTRNRKDRPQAVDGVEANSYIEVTEVASDRSRRPRKLVKSVTRAAFSCYRSAPTPWLPGQRPADGPVGRLGEGVQGSGASVPQQPSICCGRCPRTRALAVSRQPHACSRRCARRDTGRTDRVRVGVASRRFVPLSWRNPMFRVPVASRCWRSRDAYLVGRCLKWRAAGDTNPWRVERTSSRGRIDELSDGCASGLRR